MASLVICTPGGATDNCYVTEAQATAYFTNGLREAKWLGWGATRRARALIEATQEIEEELGGARDSATANRVDFRGAPATDTQLLFFPRGDDTNAVGAYVIPRGVQVAICEQAFWQIKRENAPPLVDHDANREAGVAMQVIDGMTNAYRAGATGRPRIAPRAWTAIRPYMVLAFATTG